MYDNHQEPVRFPVNDLLCSCVDAKSNDDLHEWAQQLYGKLKPVMVTRGKWHDVLGMTFDSGIEVGSCHILKEGHTRDMLETWPEHLNGNSPTPF